MENMAGAWPTTQQEFAFAADWVAGVTSVEDTSMTVVDKHQKEGQGVNEKHEKTHQTVYAVTREQKSASSHVLRCPSFSGCSWQTTKHLNSLQQNNR